MKSILYSKLLTLFGAITIENVMGDDFSFFLLCISVWVICNLNKFSYISNIHMCDITCFIFVH